MKQVIYVIKDEQGDPVETFVCDAHWSRRREITDRVKALGFSLQLLVPRGNESQLVMTLQQLELENLNLEKR